MMRVIPFVVAVALIAVCAIGQGIHTQRWSNDTSREMEVLVEKFDEIRAKQSFGDWRQVHSRELAEDVIQGAGALNYFSGSYQHRSTQQSVTVFLVCGFGRNIAVHTPDRCFTSGDMNMHDEPRPFVVKYKDRSNVTADTDVEDIPERKMRFKTARFIRESTGTDQRTFWAWHSYRAGDEEWAAPRSPRIHYGGGRPLVKVYITVDQSEKKDVDPRLVMKEFAGVFLPQVSKILGEPLEFEEEIEDDELALR